MIGQYKEIEGDLIKLGLSGEFDVVLHGCNCHCVMGAGIAPQMAKAFACDNYILEREQFRGDINKLGQIEYEPMMLNTTKIVYAVNCYTQYGFGNNHNTGSLQPLDYEALILCLRKINGLFPGLHIGLPQIGCGLAGGSWTMVKQIIKNELKNCNVTVVIYKP